MIPWGMGNILHLLLIGCMAFSSHRSINSNQQQNQGDAQKALVTTWLIDGNNLKCFRGVPDERASIIQELEKIASPCHDTPLNDTHGDNKTKKITKISNVILVFDGHHNETFQKTISPNSWFQYIITSGINKEKDRADNYIIEEALPKLRDWDCNNHELGYVHLITADKELSQRARATGVMNGGSIVYPPKFWKQYLPNLQRTQKRNQDVQK
uniref:NYN domain-containing protein n=1 Tax=Ditylum brightwellii TaxID=49249 RepID=A0A6U3ULJ5_9STRA|mmetsp:Transcript_5731/g.8733  ORF Transcript_5731/g.8733 Transcript_5731/m.8733 type:complete len:212 (+) Transcript_5731:295-930(+)